MQAITSNGPGVLQLVTDVPLPSIEGQPSNKVLVQIHAVALNHSDWKMADFSPKAGAISGYDMAGIVVATGARDRATDVEEGQIERLVEGDRVLGVTSINGGAFAEFAVCDGDLLVKVPESLNIVSASTLGVGLTTAGLALYGPEFLRFDLPGSRASSYAQSRKPKDQIAGPRGWGGISNDNNGDSDSDDGTNHEDGDAIPVMVYGASSATGTIIIQLLRLSGYAPIAVCSPKNFALMKSRGATSCWDYHTASCATLIKQYTHSRLAHAIDCITSASSMKLCYEAMGTSGGQYVSLDPFSARIAATRKDIRASFCYALTIFGLPVQLDGDFARDAKPEDHKFALMWIKLAGNLLAQGKLQAHPAVVKPGGLSGVISGIDLLRKGKVSGQKLVYKVRSC